MRDDDQLYLCVMLIFRLSENPTLIPSTKCGKQTVSVGPTSIHDRISSGELSPSFSVPFFW